MQGQKFPGITRGFYFYNMKWWKYSIPTFLALPHSYSLYLAASNKDLIWKCLLTQISRYFGDFHRINHIIHWLLLPNTTLLIDSNSIANASKKEINSSPIQISVSLSMVLSQTYPGSPPASITLAKVTSFDQTSYCHFRRPRTPQSTLPVCNPTLMLRSTSVASATDLK